jgi:hypothetical protein
MSIKLPGKHIRDKRVLLMAKDHIDVQQLNGHQKRVRSEIIFVCGYYVL